MKGMTSQEAEGWWSPIGDFRHLRYQFFPFFKLSLLVQDCYILFRIFPEVLTIFQIPLSPRFKVSNLFVAPPSSKIRSSHLYQSSNLFQSSYSSCLSKPSQQSQLSLSFQSPKSLLSSQCPWSPQLSQSSQSSQSEIW